MGTTNLGFYWTSVADATSYSFVLSPNVNLTDALVSQQTASTSLNVAGPLDYSKTYYWQVGAWKGSTLLTTSNVGVFTVMVERSNGDAKAPDFTLTDLDGRSISLRDFRGKAVLLNFWAINCPYCIAEMSYFESIYEEGKDNLVILTVNVGDSADEIRQFLTRSGLSLPVLIDSGLKATRDYDLMGIPTTFFITTEGIIKGKMIGGFQNKEAIDGRLAEILP